MYGENQPTVQRRASLDGFLGEPVEQKPKTVAPREWHPNNNPPPHGWKPLSACFGENYPTGWSTGVPSSDGSSSTDGRPSRKPLHRERGITSIGRPLGTNIQPPYRWKPHSSTVLLRLPIERAQNRYIQSMAPHQPTVSPALTPNRLIYGNP